MAPRPTPDVDPNVGWAIEQAVGAAEKRFGEMLDEKLKVVAEAHVNREVYDVAHTILCERLDTLEGWLRWALAGAIVGTLGFIGTLATGVILLVLGRL
jgi:hypothetical protein